MKYKIFIVTLLLFVGAAVTKVAISNSLASEEQTITQTQIPNGDLFSFSANDASLEDEIETQNQLSDEDRKFIEQVINSQAEPTAKPAIIPKKSSEPIKATPTKAEEEEVMIVKDTPKTFTRGVCPESSEENYSLLALSRDIQLDSYVPPNLVQINPLLPTKLNRTLCLQKPTAEAMLELIADSKKEDLSIIITSAYRSRATQATLFDQYVKTYNTEPITIAPAGTSEHQLGTTIDVTAKSISGASGSQDFGTTAEGIWMAENSWKYGFIMSYPQDKKEITGYPYEPWHFRFVGKEVALAIHENKTTAYEYLTSLGEHPEFAHTHDEGEEHQDTALKNPEVGG